MRENNFDYFTLWSVVAVIVSILIIILGKLLGRPQPWLAMFFIPLTTVVSLIGTDTVGYHLNIPTTKDRKKVIRSHLWLHTIPLYISFLTVCNWNSVVGKKATNKDMMIGMSLLLSFFACYSSSPLDTGEKHLEKIKEVYNTKDPVYFIIVGICIAIVTSFATRTASKNTCISHEA